MLISILIICINFNSYLNPPVDRIRPKIVTIMKDMDLNLNLNVTLIRHLSLTSASDFRPGMFSFNTKSKFRNNTQLVKMNFLKNKKSFLLVLLILQAGDIEQNPGPTTSNTFEPKNTSLKTLVINFQSMKNKLAEFRLMVSEEKPDIIIGTETWLNPNVKSTELNLDEFDIYRKDREDNKGWGGVILAIKKDISSEQLTNKNTCTFT